MSCSPSEPSYQPLSDQPATVHSFLHQWPLSLGNSGPEILYFTLLYRIPFYFLHSGQIWPPLPALPTYIFISGQCQSSMLVFALAGGRWPIRKRTGVWIGCGLVQRSDQLSSFGEGFFSVNIENESDCTLRFFGFSRSMCITHCTWASGKPYRFRQATSSVNLETETGSVTPRQQALSLTIITLFSGGEQQATINLKAAISSIETMVYPPLFR